MSVKVRQNDAWQNITFSVPGFSVSGEWFDETNNRLVENIYTNTTKKLKLIRVSLSINLENNPAGVTFVDQNLAGSYIVAYVRESTTSNFFEVSRFRDNGTANLDEIVIEVQFFVPQSYDYKVVMYDRNDQNWSEYLPASPVETKSWTEFEFQ